MLGAIIGDIVGSRFEFNPTNDYNFKLFTEECSFTDDTICTIAIADALLHNDDYGRRLHEWCRKYPNPKGGYGGRFREWVMSDNPQPYDSFGNGSAMRVSPIAWRYRNAEGMIGHAGRSAECTHNHPEGIKGAQAVALAIHYGDEIRRLSEKIDKDTILQAFKPVLEFTGYKINIRRANVLNKFDETCQGTVPVALWIITESTGFEDAIRKAVSLGADSDTLGAIVGSIAEAIWGVPEELAQKAMRYLPDIMQTVIHRFYKTYAYEIFPLKGNADEGAAQDLLAEEEQDEKKAQLFAVMRWKLGLGNLNGIIEDGNGLPAAVDPWFTGLQGKICERCIFSKCIQNYHAPLKSEIPGCGRCCRETFKNNYISGKCKFRQTKQYEYSEYDLERKAVALQRKREKEAMAIAKRNAYESETRAYVPFKTTYAAGTHFIKDSTAFHRLEEYSPLDLVRECDNKYDNYAVALYFRGRRIGYVPRTQNREIAAMLEAGMSSRMQTFATDVKFSKDEVRFNISVYLKPERPYLK